MFNFNYNNNRIIAIGDIHGDYLIFIELLKLAKVIDDNFNWIGNDTFVIQLGDTLDGKRPNIKIDNDFLNTTGEIEITELILKLDKKAKIYGGRVISILGNHELYPYYFNNDKSFNDKYVKKVDLKEYKKRFKMDRFKYYQPGNPGAILLGKTRPLIIQLGKFIFTHGSLNIGFVRGCLENKLNITGTNYVDINKVNKIVSDWLCGKSKKVPFFINSSILFLLPVDKSSIINTFSALFSYNLLTKFDPIKPAPPVITILFKLFFIVILKFNIF